MHRPEAKNIVQEAASSFSEKEEVFATTESNIEMSGLNNPTVAAKESQGVRSPAPSESERSTLINDTLQELWNSTDFIFQSKLTWLLIFGPVALVGSANGWLGEAACFCFSGIAIVPCAERYVLDRLGFLFFVFVAVMADFSLLLVFAPTVGCLLSPNKWPSTPMERPNVPATPSLPRVPARISAVYVHC